MSLDLEKQPAGGNINAPDSGTYGEKADLARLTQQLPGAMGGGAKPPAPAPLPPVSPEPINPTPAGQPGRPAGAPAPPGLPPAVFAPTQQPGVPASTPLRAGPVDAMPAVDAAQNRLRILDYLANSPNVSAATREWAVGCRRVLIGA